MEINNNLNINKDAIVFNLKRITNQIYKLLPVREEGVDWQTPLSTIVEELSGMHRLLHAQHEILFPLICKLEGLYILIEEKDFFLYRRTIFECLNIVQELRNEIEKEEE